MGALLRWQRHSSKGLAVTQLHPAASSLHVGTPGPHARGLTPYQHPMHRMPQLRMADSGTPAVTTCGGGPCRPQPCSLLTFAGVPTNSFGRTLKGVASGLAKQFLFCGQKRHT